MKVVVAVGFCAVPSWGVKVTAPKPSDLSSSVSSHKEDSGLRQDRQGFPEDGQGSFTLRKGDDPLQHLAPFTEDHLFAKDPTTDGPDQNLAIRYWEIAASAHGYQSSDDTENQSSDDGQGWEVIATDNDTVQKRFHVVGRKYIRKTENGGSHRVLQIGFRGAADFVTQDDEAESLHAPLAKFRGDLASDFQPAAIPRVNSILQQRYWGGRFSGGADQEIHFPYYRAGDVNKRQDEAFEEFVGVVTNTHKDVEKAGTHSTEFPFTQLFDEDGKPNLSIDRFATRAVRRFGQDLDRAVVKSLNWIDDDGQEHHRRIHCVADLAAAVEEAEAQKKDIHLVVRPRVAKAYGVHAQLRHWLGKMKTDSTTHIELSGHGNGGAFATLAAVHIRQEWRQVKHLSVVTWGAPMVGDINFQTYYYALCLDTATVRLAAGVDPLPFTPIQSTYGELIADFQRDATVDRRDNDPSKIEPWTIHLSSEPYVHVVDRAKRFQKPEDALDLAFTGGGEHTYMKFSMRLCNSLGYYYAMAATGGKPTAISRAQNLDARALFFLGQSNATWPMYQTMIALHQAWPIRVHPQTPKEKILPSQLGGFYQAFFTQHKRIPSYLKSLCETENGVDDIDFDHLQGLCGTRGEETPAANPGHSSSADHGLSVLDPWAVAGLSEEDYDEVFPDVYKGCSPELIAKAQELEMVFRIASEDDPNITERDIKWDALRQAREELRREREELLMGSRADADKPEAPIDWEKRIIYASKDRNGQILKYEKPQAATAVDTVKVIIPRGNDRRFGFEFSKNQDTKKWTIHPQENATQVTKDIREHLKDRGLEEYNEIQVFGHSILDHDRWDDEKDLEKLIASETENSDDLLVILRKHDAQADSAAAKLGKAAKVLGASGDELAAVRHISIENNEARARRTRHMSRSLTEAPKVIRGMFRSKKAETGSSSPM